MRNVKDCCRVTWGSTNNLFVSCRLCNTNYSEGVGFQILQFITYECFQISQIPNPNSRINHLNDWFLLRRQLWEWNYNFRNNKLTLHIEVESSTPCDIMVHARKKKKNTRDVLATFERWERGFLNFFWRLVSFSFLTYIPGINKKRMINYHCWKIEICLDLVPW